MARSKTKEAVDRATPISASRFRVTCLELTNDIARTGRDVVVTTRGYPVARRGSESVMGKGRVMCE